jgi:RNA polymerase sigma-70 factor (ECF subfamily)
MSTQLGGVVVAERRSGPVAGDPQAAFQQLSAAHVQAAYRLAWAILGDERDAEDAAQDAFTTAWRQRFTLRDVERFDAWFGRILVNCCRDRLRRKARSPQLTQLDLEGGLSGHLASALDRDDLYQEIARLEPDQRIVVVLRFWKDLAVDDIAEYLGVPSGTVKSRLSRSISRLRAALEEVK